MTNRYNYPVPVSELPATLVAFDAMNGPPVALSQRKQCKMAYRSLVGRDGREFQKYADALRHEAAITGHLDWDDKHQAEMLHEMVLEMGFPEIPVAWIYRNIEAIRGPHQSRRNRQVATRMLISNGSGNVVNAGDE